ncbi:MAG: NUDIX domain-containing protein [Gemmatimonadetes bacterium]|nr:NUDIX domain-containing protein [Gemmatimonadota bacterium]
MADKFKLITDVRVFLKNDRDEILMLRRTNTGYEDGNYSVIAGHLDGHEEVIEAAVREAKEEAGIEIRSIDIEVVGVMHRKENDERISFFLAASRWCGNGQFFDSYGWQ